MAVSKRLRFEIFRRDDFTCRYCGRKPPEVELTVDHVQPVALGGRDVAENLVTCCKDCNSGKTSTTADAPLVAQVAEDEIRWSAAMHAGVAALMADHDAAMDYRSQFYVAWQGWTFDDDGSNVPLEGDWKASVEKFRHRGLPLPVLLEAIELAMVAPKVNPANAFRYMCGIAWNKIGQIDDVARMHYGSRQQTSNAEPTSAADNPQFEEWQEPTKRPVVAATVAVWLATWQQAHGEDPPPGIIDEVREWAEELYPEEYSASMLVEAAEAAASMQSTDLFEWAEGPDTDSLLRGVARHYFYGWALANRNDGGGTRPTPDQWLPVALAASAAEAAGYTRESIHQAAYNAGHDRGTRLSFYSAESAVELLSGDLDDPCRVAVLSLTLEEIGELATAADARAAKAPRRRAV